MCIGTDQWLARAEEVIPGGVNTSIRRIEPRLVWVRAVGSRIYDTEGREYIDYHAAFGPSILGHAHPGALKAVVEALHEIDLLGTGVTALEIRLAERIVRHVPSAEQVLFCNSGSEATYSAIRLARAVTGRAKIVKFQGCYHGWHDYVCMNIISPPERLGKADPASAGMLKEAVEHTVVLPFNDLDAVEEAFRKHAGEIAAIILEPVPHNVGCILPGPGFLEGLREITRRKGTLLVFDEVVTGFRHSIGGYQKVCGVTPDLTTLGKSIANGYPLAAVGGRRELMERFATHEKGDVFFAGTYNGHPVGVAAALATLEELERPGVYEKLFALGERARKGLREIMVQARVPHFVTGFGSVFLTLFLEPPVVHYGDLLRNDSDLFLRYRRALLERGVFKLPMNLKRNHVSLSHTEADIDHTLEACEEAIRAVTRPAAPVRRRS